MMRSALRAAVLLGLTIGASVSSADVLSSSESGFALRNDALIAAKPPQVYASLLQIGSWWDSAHTYSGDSRNMSLDARAGGCFCERLADQGSVQHMTLVFAAPGKELRMSGGLGPLQVLGVAGSLIWKLAADGNGSRLELTYSVGGYRAGGLGELAAPVDAVLRAQLLRLKSFVETGRPASP
jgi:hypothetical protein